VTGITNPAIYRRNHDAATTCPFRITNPAIYRRDYDAATTCPFRITNPAIYRRDHNAATFSGVSTPKSRVIKTFIVTQN
jgi:hypothetical protein